MAEDIPGVPFTAGELRVLWDNKDVPWVDSILIYIYSGWRVSELTLMPVEDIDLDAGTFRGGLKTAVEKTAWFPFIQKSAASWSAGLQIIRNPFSQ